MGYVRKERNFYEYVSDNGIVYEIGDNGADFNIIGGKKFFDGLMDSVGVNRFYLFHFLLVVKLIPN